MAIKQTINFSQFCDSFSESRTNQFTYEGKRALFEYLEQYSDDTGEDVELDIIALCCEYTEYENMEELQKNYTSIKNMEDLEDHTVVIKIENSEAFIIAQF